MTWTWAMPRASEMRASRTAGGSAGEAGTAFQALHLVSGQLAPVARRQASRLEPGVADALEPAHRMTDRVAHPADLAVAALVERQLETAGRQAADARGRGRAVVQLDAGAQPVERLRVRVARHLGAVHLLDLVARVREPVREVAVV